MIHAFLMVGQSNMAGRGIASEVEPIRNVRIKVLRNGRWQSMYVPVNGDRPFSGISLAESFADAYAKEKQVDVGLIPCADGGTCLEDWQIGGLLYDHAVMQARLAQRTSSLSGILWHQGEGDCTPERYPLYEERLTLILQGFRRDLCLPEAPILVGGLGDFLADRTEDPNLKNYVFVNQALQDLAAHNAAIGFVPADGLLPNPDNLHFCAKALREFGLRYYARFREMEERG